MNNYLSILKKTSRRLFYPFQRKAIILAYHRVFPTDMDSQLLCVNPDNFKAQLQVIKKDYLPISLSQLSDSLIKGTRIPRRAVILTFDDGYFDNYYYAKDILEYFKIPATIFIAAEYLDSNFEFWWDELESLLLLSGKAPDHLEVVHDKIYTWDLSESAVYTDEDALKNKNWTVLSPNNPTVRHLVYRELHNILKPLSLTEINQILAQIRRQLNSDGKARGGYRPMNLQELLELSASAYIEIGSHTCSHPMLAAHSHDLQKKEIVESREFLSKTINLQIKSFSYPYGGYSDIGELAPSIVMESGYEVACANYSGIVTSNSSRFILPRFLVRNWNDVEFSEQLSNLIQR